MKTAILALLVLCTSTRYAAARPSVPGCYNNPADIVFVLDSSASIWRPDFLKQIQFVQNVTQEFGIGPGPSDTRVGVITFGHEVWPQFNLNDNLDASKLQKAIGSIPHSYGRRTNTGDAIDYMTNNMFKQENGGRKDVTKIAVVITDGRSQNVIRTNSAAREAHNAGIKVFAIGVGKRLDFNELREIASDPDSEYFFNVIDYTALLTITQKFTEQTCKVTATPTVPPTTTTEMPTTTAPAKIQDPKCEGKPADIFFVVDGSSSITHKNFNKELDFIQKVVKMFDIGAEKTRVGMLTFSSEAQMLFGLDNKMSKDALLEKILKVKQVYGGTNTADALRTLRQEGFAPGVARNNVAKIAIVLTDGLSSDEAATIDEAKMTHMAGIKTFAIGIGLGIDLMEIKAIASDPNDQYVYQVDDFNSLDSIKDFLVNKACSVEPNKTGSSKDEAACHVKKNTDLMFVYDTSSMGEAQANAISQFVAKVVAKLDISSGFLHVGRTTENCPNGANFELSSKLSSMDFSNIRLSTYASLIKKVRRAGFTSEYGGRQDAENVGVLFVDSVSDNLGDNTLEEAKELSKSTELFVVSIGQSQALNKFASEFAKPNVLAVNSYADLDRFVNTLVTKFCYHVETSDYNIDYVVPL